MSPHRLSLRGKGRGLLRRRCSVPWRWSFRGAAAQRCGASPWLWLYTTGGARWASRMAY